MGFGVFSEYWLDKFHHEQEINRQAAVMLDFAKLVRKRSGAKRADTTAGIRKWRERQRKRKEQAALAVIYAKSEVAQNKGYQDFAGLAELLIGKKELMQLEAKEWSPEKELAYANRLRELALKEGRVCLQDLPRNELVFYLLGMLRGASYELGFLGFEQEFDTRRIYVYPT